MDTGRIQKTEFGIQNKLPLLLKPLTCARSRTVFIIRESQENSQELEGKSWNWFYSFIVLLSERVPLLEGFSLSGMLWLGNRSKT